MMILNSLNDQYAQRIKVSREEAKSDRRAMMKLMNDVQSEKDEELTRKIHSRQ